MIRITEHNDWLGHGGYVVAPPSDGYRWFASHRLELRGIPEPLLAFLKESAPAEHVARKVAFDPDLIPPLAVAPQGWSPDGLIRAVRSATVGTRNTVLNWAAYRLGRDHADARATDAQVRSTLVELKRAALATGLTDREAYATIVSGVTAGSGG